MWLFIIKTREFLDEDGINGSTGDACENALAEAKEQNYHRDNRSKNCRACFTLTK